MFINQSICLSISFLLCYILCVIYVVSPLLQQEIEEDKKKAEQEGIAITTPRKPRPHDAEPDKRRTENENITVTVDLSRQTVVSYLVDPFFLGLGVVKTMLQVKGNFHSLISNM